MHYIPVFAAGQHAHAVDLFKAVEDVEPVLAPAEIAEADAIAADERRAVELAPDLIEEVRLVQARQRLGHSGAVDELLRLAVIALRTVHAHDSVAEYDHIRAIRSAQRIFQRVGQQQIVRVEEHYIFRFGIGGGKPMLARGGGAAVFNGQQLHARVLLRHRGDDGGSVVL